MSKEEQQQHITSIGGQAVMEGVMMRGPFKTAVAVRKPDGDIECKVEENGTKTRKKFWRLPIIRGCVSFVDSLVIGMKALMFSAEFVDIEEEEKTESNKEKTGKQDEEKRVKGKVSRDDDKKHGKTQSQRKGISSKKKRINKA